MRAKVLLITLSVVLAISMLAACQQPTPSMVPVTSAPGGLGGGGATLANPASVYCAGLGYKLTIEDTPQGQQGICAFPDGNKCEEWAFLSGRCGQSYSYCVKQGGTLKSDPNSNIATCIFANGSSCQEMDYFQGKCGAATP